MVSWGWQAATLLCVVLGIAYSYDTDVGTSYPDNVSQSGPILSPPYSEIILEKGQNITLVCKSRKEVQFIKKQDDTENIGSFAMVERYLKSNDSEYEYEMALDLLNVDDYAVGYYACFDNSIDESDVFSNVVDELNNTQHISYIYIYVNDSDALFAPMRDVVLAGSGPVVIPCRPTAPDVKVELVMNNKAQKIKKFSPKIGFTLETCKSQTKQGMICKGLKENGATASHIIRYVSIPPPKPKIWQSTKKFMDGETFYLNCSVDHQSNTALMLNWITPRSDSHNFNLMNDTNELKANNGTLYHNLIIVNATKDDEGRYNCTAQNSNGQKNATVTIKRVAKAFLKIYITNKPNPEGFPSKGNVRLRIVVDGYPESQISVLRDSKPLRLTSQKYTLTRQDNSVYFTIKNGSVFDTGNYTIAADNKYINAMADYEVKIKSRPIVDFEIDDGKRYLLNTVASLRCEVFGYPLPEVKWSFQNNINSTPEEFEKGKEKVISVYHVISYLDVKARHSGNIACMATNAYANVPTIVQKKFIVQEIEKGFGVPDGDYQWFPESQAVSIRCLASKSDFNNVTWVKDDVDNLQKTYSVEETSNELSHVALLKFDHIATKDSGTYTCVATGIHGTEKTATITVEVEAHHGPTFMEPSINQDVEVYPFQPLQLTCVADAVPKPTIEWYKDGERVESDGENVEIITDYINRTTVNSTIIISKMLDEYKGKYECLSSSESVPESRFFNIIVKEKSPFKTAYLGIIGAIFLLLLLLVCYLSWKINKEKAFRKELAKAGLLYFKEGVTKSINPELGIDQQAELLPYDERFEFPPSKLKLGKQLGAGAFGVVYKAEARGIVDAEQTTTVAVKMVKKTADNMYIKALASELKIMVHLGKHVNIVNLLGACTKNVDKRELLVIVEYCKFGNIHNYLQKHREVFIDQFSENKERTIGRVNRGFSCSSGTSANPSEYFGSSHTQNTDHTFLNTANTNCSTRKASETGYVQPEWRSNYECDYSYDDGRSPRPLCSRDLLCWAFQIARGMEYLASRKVLHGDLAARNILLAEDNVVKICDFGLARSIYNNDEYRKKENSPLPIKWLAIECMMDYIFSTQSDVWSFGIVLWELFSLARTPYPNIEHKQLVKWLEEGNRLDKPQYADQRLYDMMLRCWDQKPTVRPSFTQLQETLGSYLEDNVRNHYVDLNSNYMDFNTTRQKDGEDYLAMVSAPDYNNLVTPSPHHYVNETSSNFFPPTPTLQLQHDDEGYLQMSPATNQTIFSPRSPSKFDFDPRKLNPRVEYPDDSIHPELTPMLTLNNMPARSGSESDHEGSAYLKMCPRIDEETDEVFQSKNAKNVVHNHNSAVTNPTYISFDVGVDKKQEIIASENKNSYVNISGPNGLVK